MIKPSKAEARGLEVARIRFWQAADIARTCRELMEITLPFSSGLHASLGSVSIRVEAARGYSDFEE
jgi:hypothetical protein